MQSSSAITADQSTCRDAEMLLIAAILATLDDPFYDPPEHLVKYETPQQRRSYTAWASKLRDDLIGDDSGYDQVVPPRSDARSALAGTPSSSSRASTWASRRSPSTRRWGRTSWRR